MRVAHYVARAIYTYKYGIPFKYFKLKWTSDLGIELH